MEKTPEQIRDERDAVRRIQIARNLRNRKAGCKEKIQSLTDLLDDPDTSTGDILMIDDTLDSLFLRLGDEE